MTEVRKILMRPRLGRLVRQGGGCYVVDALRRADAAIDEMREPLLLTIDQHISTLEDLAGALSCGAGQVSSIYQSASDIISLCVAEQNEAVEAAARSLCCLVDESRSMNTSLVEGVFVHVASIKLLHRAPCSDLQAPILAGLRKVLEKQRAPERIPQTT